MSEPTKAKKSAAQKGFITFLLALPYVFLCFPQMYNRATPAVLGFPFFYWYQLGWVILTSALLWIVYLQLRSE